MDTVGSTLFKAIPPSLESKEYDTIINNLKSLNIATDSIVTEYNKNTCRPTTTTTATGTTTNSQIQYIQAKLDKYQNDLYTVKNITARNTIELLPPTTTSEKQPTIEIRTYAETIDTNNCMSASWYGMWNISIINETTCTMNGTITIQIHYYERGSNIQTRCIQNYSNRIVSTKEEKVNTLVAKFEKQTMSYEEQLSNSIIKELSNIETLLYTNLQEIYTTNVSLELKQLRRILPITKTRFKWNTAAQKQVQLLNEKKNTSFTKK